MTEKNNPRNETVDWAERLKASMNAEPADPPARATAPTAEEDDLAALLRAQLAHRAESAEAFTYDLDTSEFEDETEEAEEAEEAEAAEESEETSEAEEIPADLPWDEDEEAEDEPVPVPAPAPAVAETNEDTPADLPWDEEDETEDEPVPAPAPAPAVAETNEDTPADLPWDEGDETEDEPVPAPAPAPAVAETNENTPADLPWDEEDETEEPAVSVFTPARGYTIEPVPYDEDEELIPDTVTGDVRLLAAEEESNRLLEELYATAPAEETETPEAEAEETQPTAAEEPAPHPAKPRRSEPAPRTVSHDPLQLGLDDVYPRVPAMPSAESDSREARPASPRKPVTPVKPEGKQTADYSDRMAPHANDREETARDAELYLRLGYEEQLTRSEQQEAIEEARRRARERQTASSRNETSPVKVRREFTDREQTPAIERAYGRSRRLAMTRLCVALVGAFFGILHDLLGILLMPVSSVTYTDTLLYPLVSVALTVLFCLPFLSRLGRGLKSLFDFEPTRYAVSALALPVAILHGCLSVFTRSPYLYGGVALFMLAVAAATEYITTVAEAQAFSVVSSGKTAFVLTDETTPASVANAEQSPDERTLTAIRTDRVSDFFARTGRYNPYMGRLNYLLPVALLAAIICAGVAILQGGELMFHGLTVFTATYLSCLPAAYLVAMSLPLLAANSRLRAKGAAVLGTAAPSDICKKGSTRLLIRDGDAVGGLHRKEITLRDDPKAELWRKKAACLFRLLECPLWNESPLGDDLDPSLCVEVAETEEEYVRLFLIDLERGETNEVSMGSREALTRRGIRLPKASMESVYKRSDKSHVIYLAFDGTFRMAYAVEYRLGTTFARAVEKLSSMGDTAALITYDPFVGQTLLRVDRLKDCSPAAVLRPAYIESPRKSCSAGVVATGRGLDLLYPYAACRRMRRAYRLSHLVGWLTLPVSVGLSLLTVFMGHHMALSGAAVIAIQILLAATSAVISLTQVTKKNLFLTSDTPRPSRPTAQTPPKNTTKTDKE